VKISVLVAATAAAGLLLTAFVTGMTGAATAAPVQPGATLNTVNLCHPTIAGKAYDLGCGVFAKANPNAAKPAGYGPADLATALHLPAGGAAGTVSVMTFGFDPQLESDLAVYRKTYGLPACDTANGCLHIMDDKGGPALQPGLDPIAIGMSEAFTHETMLDVDMVSASCPGCSINVIQIPFTEIDYGASLIGQPGTIADGFANAVHTAAAHQSSAVTTSFFISTGNQADYLLHGAPATAFDHPGMALVGASGDNGYQGTSQVWPAELPTVTAVGGVALTTGSNGDTVQAWSDSQSGCAAGVAPATGQPANVAADCKGTRAIADVSAVATDLASYDTYYPTGVSVLAGIQPGWTQLQGTSAASPYIAGLYARGGNLTGVHGPNTLYSAPADSITNVTTGSNSTKGCAEFAAAVCTAGPGWNGPTGVGIPNGLGAF
jgi:hypothetical protein